MLNVSYLHFPREEYIAKDETSAGGCRSIQILPKDSASYIPYPNDYAERGSHIYSLRSKITSLQAYLGNRVPNV